jgi:arylsulfatase A-like enzyme
VDTLRADHLGLYGYPRLTSENLDRWAEQGRIFEQALATSSWTLPSFGSILTGHIPARHRAGRRSAENDWKRVRQLDESLPTLAETLRAEGFATGAIVNNPWLKPRFGFERGFDTYDFARTTGRILRRADEVVDLALDWIDGHRDRPFFLLVHMFDPHLNYDAPEPVRGRFTAPFRPKYRLPVVGLKQIRERVSTVEEREKEFITAAYDEEVAFVDQEIARFFSALGDRDLWDRLLVVLTSDHGEELFDHGGFEHGHAHFQETLRVPLIVWGEQISPGRSARPVSQVDLMPTVLDAIGIPHAEFPVARSLWPHLTARDSLPVRPLIAEATMYGPERWSILEWPLKLEVEPVSGNRRLFDLVDDARELHNLAENEKDTADRLADLFVAIRRNSFSEGEPDAVEMDEETLGELRALGYVE